MIDEQANTVKALQTAMQMEIDGKQYYLKASQASRNGLGQKLFQTLSGEEDLHLRNFEKIYQAIQTKKQWPPIQITPHSGRDLKTLFAEATDGVNSTTSELGAVQTAMAMENKTRDFYRQQGEIASFEAEKKYYSLLAGEEGAHHAVLLDYYEYLSNPGQYFTLKERQSLDGG
jgi:rubrerythrin